MRIVFFGTPEFAAEILSSIFEAGHEIVGVVTQPDKPFGRKKTLTPPPVKIYAEGKNLPVFQPEKLRNGDFSALYRSLSPDMAIVASYGKILPAEVLTIPAHGCLNVHASLLPAYRGASPIQRAIMDGCVKTGITIMRMDEGIDTGDMLLKGEIDVHLDDDYAAVHDKLAFLGGKLIVQAIDSINHLVPEKQDGSKSNYASKITAGDCFIDFTEDAKRIHDKVRALSPRPLAFSCLDGKKIKFVRTSVECYDNIHGQPGEVVEADKTIKIACGKGLLELILLIPEGKNKMNSSDFVRGRNISTGDKFEKE